MGALAPITELVLGYFEEHLGIPRTRISLRGGFLYDYIPTEDDEYQFMDYVQRETGVNLGFDDPVDELSVMEFIEHLAKLQAREHVRYQLIQSRYKGYL